MRRILLIAVATALAACASNPGVIQTGPNSYTVGRQAKTGFYGGSILQLKAQAVADAQGYCAKSGRQAKVTNSSESQGPYVFGTYPRAEVEFECVASRQ